MPYEKISDAPANIRRLRDDPDSEPIPLTLTQLNWIARVVDGIKAERDNPEVTNPFAVAITQFKRAHEVQEGKWMPRKKEEMRERVGERASGRVGERVREMILFDDFLFRRTFAIPFYHEFLLSFKAVKKHETPKADIQTEWDGDAAEGRIRRWASGDGSGDKDTIDWDRYALGFAWVNEDAPDNFGSYKLPHHDVVDGRLMVVWKGLDAAGKAIQGARGGVQIPPQDLEGVMAHLAMHYEQFDRTAPWSRS